ncbi:hypothetical protein YSA_05132 [Pseudomonas putida ND6]|uniref:Uncharacterized protein n=1 Tax=Pseudomonas putida ND6 TaxID=231023 RepID=I3UVM5_PSEPU|nr:hypothetical protein YSA_05132 [Pseudomonas putida ND6]
MVDGEIQPSSAGLVYLRAVTVSESSIALSRSPRVAILTAHTAKESQHAPQLAA